MSGPLNNYELRKLLLSYPAKAIKILCNEYYDSLLKIAFKLTHDRDASKDVVQDTFLYLWENAREIAKHRERSIQHYLVGIVRNKSVTYYRELILLGKRKFWFMDSHSRGEEPIESRIIQIEVTQQILDTIARFPKRERECLILKMDQELSNEEIAACLDVGRKAVERSLASAKKRLRKYLQDRPEQM